MLSNGSSCGESSSSAGSGGGGGTVTLKKGPWTATEDAILVEYVKKHGEGNWNSVQKNSGLSRCGKSCRLRWANHLRPNLKKGSFSPEEERLILELHSKLGNKWARMAAQLPGRTDNEIKNYWNTRIKRRQRAGLPLYPPDIQRQTAFQNHQNRPSSSPSPSPSSTIPSLQQKAQFTSHHPLLDPMNLSTPPTTTTLPLLTSNQPHTFLPISPIQRFKRFRDNNSIGSTNFSLPFSSALHSLPLLHQNLHSPHQQQQTQQSFQFSPGNFELNQFNFEPIGLTHAASMSMKMELPSTQFSEHGVADLGLHNYRTEPTNLLGQSSGGLLESLLLEPQVMVSNNEDLQREGFLSDPMDRKCSLEDWIGGPQQSGQAYSDASSPQLGPVGQWDESSPAQSSTGIKSKTEPADENNSVDNDLSTLLDIIPASMSTVPEWYGDNKEMPDAQNGVVEDDIGLEMQQLASSLSTTTEPDWTLDSCPWNNMPGIC